MFKLYKLYTMLVLVALSSVWFIPTPGFAATSTGLFRTVINFQPASSSDPDTGAFQDTGLVYGERANGLRYGWNADNTANMRDRSYDVDIYLQRFAHMQKGGTYTWEIAVPNGVYDVSMSAGDAFYTNSIYKINVEGVRVIDYTPTTARQWGYGSKIISVTDGKLTVTNAPGAVNNKINYIRINQRFDALINFQPGATNGLEPLEYKVDNGLKYADRGNGLSYGWNADNQANMRYRSTVDIDHLRATLARMQHNGSYTWEIAVPEAGFYNVRLAVGDVAYTDSVYKVAVEGQLLVDFVPDNTKRGDIVDAIVKVTDGKLTVSNASGALNNKIQYIEITNNQ